MHFTINYHAFNPHPPSRKQQQPSLQKKTQTHKKTPKKSKQQHKMQKQPNFEGTQMFKYSNDSVPWMFIPLPRSGIS